MKRLPFYILLLLAPLGAGAEDPAAFARELGIIFEGAFAIRHLRPPEPVVPVFRRMTATLFAQQLPPVARP